MGLLEIILLLAGVGIAAASFLIPLPKENVPAETKKLAKDEIKTLVSKEIDSIRNHVDDVVDEAVEYAMEKTERSLERLTNEKIMAVNEYSDTVLKEIHKNHEEAMFLYDMLNAKHTNLKNTVSEVNKTVQEAEETKREAEAVVSTFHKLKPEKDQTGDVQHKIDVITDSGRVPGHSETNGAKIVQIPRVKTQEQESDPVVPSPSVMNFMTVGRETYVNSNDKILDLYKQGKNKVEIARELGLGVGEVKLVIDLYRSL